MLLASGDWIFSTAWGFIAIPVALLIGALTVWAGRRGESTRHLGYSMPSVTPLLTGSHPLSEQLELRRGDTVLKDPRVVVLKFVVRGHKDILTDDFTAGPLILDLNVSVLEVLSVKNKPEDTPVPQVEPGGTTVRIGPSMLHPRQEVSISVLVDGKEPTLSKPLRTLANVKLDRDPDVYVTRRMEVTQLIWVHSAMGLATVAIFTTLGPNAALSGILALYWATSVFVSVPLHLWSLRTLPRQERQWHRKAAQQIESGNTAPRIPRQPVEPPESAEPAETEQES